MEIVNSLIDFFGINLLNETSTFIDFINVSIKVFIGVFIFSFFIRCVFLVATIPSRRGF